MGLDLMSFLDYGYGGRGMFMEIIALTSSVWLALFMSFFGFFWFASCREWAGLSVLFGVVDSTIIKGKSVEQAVGMPQLVFCLFLTLLSTSMFSFGPLVFPWTSQVWVPLALAFPFWGGSVVYSLSSMNWQSFLTSFVAGGSYFNTFLFLALEMVTISFRVITLSVRLTLNILVSLICAKLLFSLTLGVLWLGSPLSMLLSGDFSALWYVVFMSASMGYYVFEWFIGLLQSWLFTFLVVSYYDEGQMELKKVVSGLKLVK